MNWPDKKYQIIYADPPWEYKNSGGIKSSRGLAKKYYGTMNLGDLRLLRVDRLADDNCSLFLWTTAPKIQEALQIMHCWGFSYFTIDFTWVKANKKNGDLFLGMGTTTRANAEYVLLGRKGKLERKAKNVSSVLISPIREHSRKPAEIRERIELLYGNLPRIELFARDRADGWDVWGNEAVNL